MNNQSFDANHPHSRKLTAQQKIGVVILSLFSVAVFVFWFVELRSNIAYLPYGGVNPAQLAAQSGQQASSTVADTTDTDGDGLVDSDELNKYQTSPYLADSDGDGINDSQELADKTDPNCPEGTTCSTTGLYSDTSEMTATSSVSATTNLFSVTTQDGKTLKEAFGDAPDATSLRATLLLSASDEDKAMIDKLTDAQLTQLYQTMVSSVSQTSSQ